MEASGRGKVQLRGYYPGVVGKITEIHALYYHEKWGFDVTFEIQVGQELSDFMGHFTEGRDGFWVATIDGEFAGSIAIDGREAVEEGARLRWFIVSPKFQGGALGQRLIREAISHCRERGFNRIYLWTFEGLDAARSLYEKSGFHLSEEHDVHQWGQDIREQKFELEL
jgi:GNAT superfamily N-acetyltransferase